jgi:hypothetical protein
VVCSYEQDTEPWIPYEAENFLRPSGEVLLSIELLGLSVLVYFG